MYKYKPRAPKKSKTTKQLAKEVKALKKSVKEYFPYFFNVFDNVTLTANTLDINEIAVSGIYGNGAVFRGISIEMQFVNVPAGTVPTHARLMLVRDNEPENATAISATEILQEDKPYSIYNYQRCSPPKSTGIKKDDQRINNNPTLFDEMRYDILYDKRFYMGGSNSSNEDKDLSIYVNLHDVQHREDDRKYYICCIADTAIVCDVQVITHGILPVAHT